MEYSKELLDAEATFFDTKSYKELFPGLKQDTFFSLYYLKSKDIFITISDTPDSIGQEITDEILDRQYRETYLKISKPLNEFCPTEHEVGVEYDSDLKYLTLGTILQTGRELETKEELVIYYMGRFDVFVAVELINAVDKVFRYTFQDNSLRKKYNIQYQDERFQDF